MKESHLKYLQQSCLLRLLNIQSRNNECLRERLGRAEAAEFKDALGVEEHHWSKYQHSTDKEWSQERPAIIQKVKEMASEECVQLASWLNKQEGST